MFDFGLGSTELLLIAIVAIIVVGPKDLPRLLRAVGQVMTKVRSLAREFQSHLDEAAREAGIDDVKKEISKATDFTKDLDSGDDDLSKAFEDAASDLKGDPIRDAEVDKKPAASKPAKKKPRAKKPAAKRSKASAASSAPLEKAGS